MDDDYDEKERIRLPDQVLDLREKSKRGNKKGTLDKGSTDKGRKGEKRAGRTEINKEGRKVSEWGGRKEGRKERRKERRKEGE